LNEGPLHGLQLTVNVQKYENLPFSEQDSGIKASRSFAILKFAVENYYVVFITFLDSRCEANFSNPCLTLHF